MTTLPCVTTTAFAQLTLVTSQLDAAMSTSTFHQAMFADLTLVTKTMESNTLTPLVETVLLATSLSALFLVEDASDMMQTTFLTETKQLSLIISTTLTLSKDVRDCLENLLV
jgi:hypothetical protein